MLFMYDKLYNDILNFANGYLTCKLQHKKFWCNSQSTWWIYVCLLFQSFSIIFGSTSIFSEGTTYGNLSVPLQYLTSYFSVNKH